MPKGDQGDTRRLGRHRRPAGRRRLPLLRRGYEPGTGLTAALVRFQSGVISDYVTWIVLGLAGLGGVLTFVLR